MDVRLSLAVREIDEAITLLQNIRPDISGMLSAIRLDLAVEDFVETGSTGLDDLVVNTRSVANIGKPRW